ncbi:MAG: 50S ribosomal protein L10 [Candidatus Micrarchaeota archaeon]
MAYTIDIEKPSVKTKVEKIKQIVSEINSSKTVAILELTKLPDALLQNLRKKLRGHGKIIVAKKPVMLRVIKQTKLATHEKECDKPIALILTDLSPIKLNKLLKENKRRRAAKVGEVAPFEIIIPEGETDLPAGPALSELKSAGLNVQIRAGKIAIIKDSVVAKVGEVITEPKAKAMQKLNVMPFEVVAKIITATDKEYVYDITLLNIDETLNVDMQRALSDAFNMSLNTNYPTKQNIDLLLQNAYRQSIDLSVNGALYSSSTIEQLLASGVRQGAALTKLG